MICNLIRIVGLVQAAVLWAQCCNAAIIFDLRSTAAPPVSIAGNVLTVVRSGLTSGGVTFDATLTVTGNGVAVSTSSTGMGTGLAGDNNVSGSDFLSFSMSVNVIGAGSIIFNGFESVSIQNLGSTEKATLNRDGGAGETINGTLNGAFPLAYTPTTFPTAFVLSGQVGSYQVSQVDALFTGTAAVPEPSALIPSLFIFAVIIGQYRRLRFASPTSVNSL